jgi:hypothetical protein
VLRSYHRHVQQAIKLFAERADNKKHFLSVTAGSTIIHVHHPTNRKLVLEYKPDATIISNNRSKIVFQVLDAQARKNREIEADMIRAFLSPEVSIMVFVTESRAYAEKVDGISRIISENLHSYGVKDQSLPITLSLVIPKSIRSADGMLRYFSTIRGKLTTSL